MYFGLHTTSSGVTVSTVCISEPTPEAKAAKLNIEGGPSTGLLSRLGLSKIAS
jgi:hypothetical protein